ncbi:MAG: flap endonuclease-1 [Candidatus Micrarchaeia archaeon]
MGVDIAGILEKRELALSELSGKTLAVDAFNTLYQFITIIRQPDGTPLMDSRGRITSHLSGLFYRTCSLLEKGIRPVFVFDGEPSELKKRTIAERSALKHEAEEARREALERGDLEEAGMLAQRTARLSSKNVVEAKRLLDLMGVPWVQAPSEGEAQCAAMAAEGIVYAAASQDFDSLLFGAPVLVRNLALTGKRKVPRRNAFVDVLPEEFVLEDNLRRLGISRRKLVWIGLLSGTDFNAGVYGIGAKKALKLVQSHDSFQEILGEIGEEMDWREVEEFFLNPPVRKVRGSELVFREPDREAVTAFMHGEHDFSVERVENALKRAFKEPKSSSQSQLSGWM